VVSATTDGEVMVAFDESIIILLLRIVIPVGIIVAVLRCCDIVFWFFLDRQ
jgi:hypothetical protein